MGGLGDIYRECHDKTDEKTDNCRFFRLILPKQTDGDSRKDLNHAGNTEKLKVTSAVGNSMPNKSASPMTTNTIERVIIVSLLGDTFG